jgi:tetratricopeptide (TPR) repeat protein
MVYAHLQLGQDKQARVVMDEMMQESDFKATVLGAHYALAASPARHAVERGDWNGASQLSVRPSPFNFVMAISHFARALGAARSGKPEAAKADIAKLAELRDKLREAKDAYWAEIVDIQRQVAAAWVLHAEGKYDEALKAMSAAADAEDRTEKHALTPGPLAPSRELYGEMLLDRGMAKEALAAFEATKAKEPNRFRGFLGAVACALSNPDGYTYCLLSVDSISLAPHLFAKLSYDLFKQLVPLTRLFFIVQGLMVHPSLGVNTPTELVALSKSKPGTLSYATQGSHITLFMEEFKRVSGADLQRVPFTAGEPGAATIYPS